MQVEFLEKGGKAVSTILDLIDRCDSMSWAVAWATDNPIANAASEYRHKFKHLVIGTHGFVTDPDVIGSFQGEQFFKIKLPTGPLFHPKTYLFEMGDRLVAVVGSHNLTRRAFSENIEASMMLTGALTEPALMDLAGFIRKEWHAGIQIDDSWLYSYRANHRRASGAHRELEKWVPILPPTSDDEIPGPQDLTWKQYVALVKQDETHGLAGRLRVLEEVAKLFRKASSFAELDVQDRKRIAGTAGYKLGLQDGIDWAWFGAMSASPSFATTVISNPDGFSEALEFIPLAGPVERDDYERYVERFMSGFQNTRAGGGIATGTRLLAMKRPDQFVCVDGPNKRGICKHFGYAVNTTSLDNYWDRVIEPMRQTAWWLAPRPTNPLERRIWESRAAMLDAIYYDPDQR